MNNCYCFECDAEFVGQYPVLCPNCGSDVIDYDDYTEDAFEDYEDDLWD